MQEKRRHKRFVVDELGINGRMLFASDVKILDISLGGVSLRADKRFEIGRDYSLRLEYEGKSMALDGTVIWSFLRGSGKSPKGPMVPLYEAGIKFKELSIEKTTEIENFIRKHGVEEVHRPSGSRLNVRAAVDPPEKAVVNFSDGYKLKKLSLGGMLIESGCELEVENRLPMEMSLPNGMSVVFLGRVAFCLGRKGKEGDRYDIGIEFVDMAKEDRKRIEKFIGLLGKEPGSPPNISVRTREPK